MLSRYGILAFDKLAEFLFLVFQVPPESFKAPPQFAILKLFLANDEVETFADDRVEVFRQPFLALFVSLANAPEQIVTLVDEIQVFLEDSGQLRVSLLGGGYVAIFPVQAAEMAEVLVEIGFTQAQVPSLCQDRPPSARRGTPRAVSADLLSTWGRGLDHPTAPVLRGLALKKSRTSVQNVPRSDS